MSPEITIFIAKAATDKRVWIAVIATVCALLFCLASCSAFSISSLVAFSTYPSEPDDLLAVEAAYSELETQHIESLKNSEQTKPGYDEYRYQKGTGNGGADFGAGAGGVRDRAQRGL